MKKNATLLVAGLLASTSSVGFAKNPKLNLSEPSTFDYQCNDGSSIQARYYGLSDNSLSFVKLTIKGEVYTLPNLSSASGARYSDMNRIEWWGKGSNATLDEDVTDDKSKLVECKEINKRHKNKRLKHMSLRPVNKQ